MPTPLRPRSIRSLHSLCYLPVRFSCSYQRSYSPRTRSSTALQHGLKGQSAELLQGQKSPVLKCFTGLRQPPHRNEPPMNCKKGTRIRAHRTLGSDVNHAVALRQHGSGFPSFLCAPIQMLTALKLHSPQCLFKLTYRQHYKGIWHCFRRTPHSHLAWDSAPQTWL